MATITLPANFRLRQANAGYQYAQGVIESPYSLQRSVQNWGGRRRVVEVEIPPVSKTEASNWASFFEDLNGCVNTFNLDLRDLYPHDTGASSVPFRLLDPNIQWSADVAEVFGFSFQAVEVI